VVLRAEGSLLDEVLGRGSNLLLSKPSPKIGPLGARGGRGEVYRVGLASRLRSSTARAGTADMDFTVCTRGKRHVNVTLVKAQPPVGCGGCC
jgi:hypothetical protein